MPSDCKTGQGVGVKRVTNELSNWVFRNTPIYIYWKAYTMYFIKVEY